MASEHAPAAGAGPGGERLLAAHLLLQVMHERTPVDEGIVTQALDPMWVPTLEEASSWHEGLYAMLRTASYYIVDQEQTYEAIESMPPALPSFPPLPFRRIWIETQHTYDDGSVQPGMYTSWLDEIWRVILRG